jgi:hypothetical protein
MVIINLQYPIAKNKVFNTIKQVHMTSRVLLTVEYIYIYILLLTATQKERLIQNDNILTYHSQEVEVNEDKHLYYYTG